MPLYSNTVCITGNLIYIVGPSRWQQQASNDTAKGQPQWMILHFLHPIHPLMCIFVEFWSINARVISFCGIGTRLFLVYVGLFHLQGNADKVLLWHNPQ